VKFIEFPDAVLVAVNQTYDNLAEIDRLLSEIRRICKSPKSTLRVDILPPNEKQIHERLSQPCEVAYENLTIREVANQLNDALGVTVLIDRAALDREGFDGWKRKATYASQGGAAKEVLTAILTPLGLTYMVDDDAIWITTPDMESYCLRTAALDVTDLIFCENFDRRAEHERFKTLRSLIEQFVAPQSWIYSEGEGYLAEGLPSGAAILFVVQRPGELQGQRAL
jgi:hypothetical protein